MTPRIARTDNSVPRRWTPPGRAGGGGYWWNLALPAVDAPPVRGFVTSEPDVPARRGLDRKIRRDADVMSGAGRQGLNAGPAD